jgi:two-component system cell cycle sensor histidine kinase/response regulator CckA
MQSELRRHLTNATHTLARWRSVLSPAMPAAHEQVRTSSAWYLLTSAEIATFVEGSPIGFALLNHDGEALCVNQALAAFLGRTAAQLEGSILLDLASPSEAHRFAEVWSAVKHGERVEPLVRSFAHPRGAPIWARIHFAPTPGFDGHAQMVLAAVEDITELKAAQMAGAAQTALLDMASDAIMVRGVDGTIKYFNPAAERLFECPRERALGRSFDEVTRVLDPASYDEADRLLLTRGEWSGELAHQLPSGRVAVLYERWTLLRDEAGLPREVLNFSSDVTDAKQRGLERERAARLESLGRFAGGIAHDFNNLLTVILGNASLARSTITAEQPASLALDNVMTATQRAAELVRGMLQFGRQEQVERAVLQAEDVAGEALELARAAATGGVHLLFDSEQHLPPVLANSGQLHQVVSNLIANAMAAIRGTGTVHVTVSRALLSSPIRAATNELPPGDYVCISVRDTGAGMNVATLERIFEPFFTTKEIGRGTGLGLAVVLGIVHAHEGGILVRSAPGQGSEFRVYLPAALPVAPLHKGPESADLPRGNGERIVCVDDDLTVLAVLERMLELLGYEVVSFSDPEQAIARVVSTPLDFAAVLTDLLMPGRSGIEVARAVRAVRDELPVGLVSAYFSDQDLAAARESGVRAFLPKPPDLSDLARFVHGLLHGNPMTAGFVR